MYINYANITNYTQTDINSIKLAKLYIPWVDFAKRYINFNNLTS